MKRNIEELSTKGFISGIMIIYLLSTLSIVGIVTDKIIKTDKTLINLKEYVALFEVEKCAIETLKEYLKDLEIYDIEYEEYLNKLEENKDNDLEEEIEEPQKVDQPEVIYANGNPIFFNFYGNQVEISYLNVVINIEINDYRIDNYSIS